LRELSHRTLDDMLDYVEQIRARPVWQPIPQDVRAQFPEDVPDKPVERGMRDLTSRHAQGSRIWVPPWLCIGLRGYS
jgi:hypothetical protein